MVPLLVLATVFLVSTSIFSSASSSQEVGVLHIKVVLVDAQQKAASVARHALLISDNPTSAPPRRVVTALDGTVDVRLRPGNYTVESDQPVAFEGKAYQWMQIVDIAAGRDVTLELTTGNAEVEPVSSAPTGSAPTASAAAPETDPSFLLPQWKDSVVALWTAKTYASGFVFDAKGLIVTSQRVIGTAASVEVQLTPAVKVAGIVLAADAVRDVAVLWIDPRVVASIRPVPLGCTEARTPLVAGGQEIWTIGAPNPEERRMTSGAVSRVEPHAILSDFILNSGSAGGPVFTAGGSVVGITTVTDENNDSNERRRVSSRVVPIADACDVIASAEKKMKDASPPDGTLLPVEPMQPFPVDALKDAAQGRAGGFAPYQVSSSDFDVSFITPVLTYGAQQQSLQPRPRTTSKDTRKPEPEPVRVRPLMDFGAWSEYVADFRPVLLVRVTPRFVEGFWTMIARGAARTQGVSLPPIKRFKPGFSRMSAFCGDAEVTPIHPFKLEQRISDTEAINEGLYVFDPEALGPHCATVKLVLYSEKEPGKGETRVVDAKVIQQIWQDFAPYRTATAK